MTKFMNVDEPKGVCKNRNWWRSIGFAYPMGTRHEFMHLQRLLILCVFILPRVEYLLSNLHKIEISVRHLLPCPFVLRNNLLPFINKMQQMTGVQILMVILVDHVKRSKRSMNKIDILRQFEMTKFYRNVLWLLCKPNNFVIFQATIHIHPTYASANPECCT